jgi:hypothetical protein
MDVMSSPLVFDNAARTFFASCRFAIRVDFAVGVVLDVVGAAALASLGWAPALAH